MSTDICFINPVNRGLILLPKSIGIDIRKRLQDRKSGSRIEAGGVFLGTYRGPHIEITDITKPLPKDIRSSRLFHRIDPGHQRKASELWAKSGNTKTYVGEWHTHTGGNAKSSFQDRLTWQSISLYFRGSCKFFLIISDKGIWGEVRLSQNGKTALARRVNCLRWDV